MKMRPYGVGALSGSRARRGLTLGEMLVVVAVFSILTLLFVGTSHQVMVRTRSVRVANDHRVIADRIEYHDFMGMGRVPSDLDRIFQSEHEIPIDPFSAAAGRRDQYFYVPNLSPDHRWIIVSRGPNGNLDIEEVIRDKESTSHLAAHQPYLMSSEEAEALLNRFRYDPTNGIISDGDIITVEGRRNNTQQ